MASARAVIFLVSTSSGQRFQIVKGVLSLMPILSALHFQTRATRKAAKAHLGAAGNGAPCRSKLNWATSRCCSHSSRLAQSKAWWSRVSRWWSQSSDWWSQGSDWWSQNSARSSADTSQERSSAPTEQLSSENMLVGMMSTVVENRQGAVSRAASYRCMYKCMMYVYVCQLIN